MIMSIIRSFMAWPRCWTSLLTSFY